MLRAFLQFLSSGFYMNNIPVPPKPRHHLLAVSPKTNTQKSKDSEVGREMNWANRKIHLYNVTMGLYMLDWWERCLFNTLVLILLWCICLNGSRFLTDLYESHLKARIVNSGKFGMGISMPSS